MSDPSPDPTPGKPRPSSGGGAANWGAMAGSGFEFVIAVLLLGGLGWWLDGKAGTQPWLMLVGAWGKTNIGVVLPQ